MWPSLFLARFRYDNSMKESMFSVGLQGIKEDDVEKVKEIIQDTFNKVAK